MSIGIQLLSLLVYFVFGIIIYSLSLFQSKIKKTIIVVITIFILFAILNYHINYLTIHPYFLTSFFLGFLFSKICVNKLKRLLHIKFLKRKK